MYEDLSVARKHNLDSIERAYYQMMETCRPLSAWLIYLYTVFYGLLLCLSAFIHPINLKLEFQYIALAICSMGPITYLLGNSKLSAIFLYPSNWQKLYRIPVFITILWLAIIWLAHSGSSSNTLGILSGLCFLLFSSALATCVSSNRNIATVLARGLAIALCTTLLTESFFLLVHLKSGISLNGAYGIGYVNFGSLEYLPRIFINTRDGNTLAVALACLGYAFIGGDVFSIKSSRINKAFHFLLGLACLNISFSSALITNARGACLAPFGGLFALFLIAFVNRNWVQLRKLFYHLLIVSLALAAAFIQHRLLTNSLGISMDSVGSIATRTQSEIQSVLIQDGSSGRWLLWSIWIKQGFGGHWLWGSGFNFIPNLPQSLSRIKDPHNIIVHLISSSGISGFFVLCMWIATIVKQCRKAVDKIKPFIGFTLISLFCYACVAAVFAWPSGIWLYSMLPSLILSAYSSTITTTKKTMSRMSNPIRRICAALIWTCLVVNLFKLKSIWP